MGQYIKLFILVSLPSFLVIALGWWTGGDILALCLVTIILILHGIVVFGAPSIIRHIIRARRAHTDVEKRYQEYINSQKLKYGLEHVTLMIAPSPQPNVATWGRSRMQSYLLLTMGSIELVSDADVKAMIHYGLATLSDMTLPAHTIIASYAALLTTISQMGQFSILRDEAKTEGNSLSSLVFFLVAPLASFFIKLLVDRSIYFRSDKRSVSFTRQPSALVSALDKVEAAVQKELPLIAPNPSLAFLYMSHPFVHKTLRRLFNIHPSTESRITKIDNMIV